MESRTLSAAFVLPSQIPMYTARQLTRASLEEIGREFGGRHHTTVLHSIKRIGEIRRSDEALNRIIQRLLDAVAAQA